MYSTFIFIIQIIVTIFCVVAASFFDIRKNIIPDKISIFLVIFGIITNMILSLITFNIKFILSSIISLIITYFVCFLFWRLKIWGGGDVKLLTGIATVIPFGILIDSFNISPLLSFYPFSFSVIANAILVTFPILIVMIFYLNVKNSVFDNRHDLIFNLISYRNFILFIKTNFNKLIKINELEEGMIVNEYYFNDRRIHDLISAEESNLKVYELADNKNYSYYFKSISAGGITEKDAYQLKIMESQDILSGKISIKYGFPFAPSILIGLIIAIFFGDIVMILSKSLSLVI